MAVLGCRPLLPLGRPAPVAHLLKQEALPFLRSLAYTSQPSSYLKLSKFKKLFLHQARITHFFRKIGKKSGKYSQNMYEKTYET
ncbi:MAG: hypothetical protein ACXAEX_14900 [Promethearchaeota archaeon]|jgi:hypothetical protein